MATARLGAGLELAGPGTYKGMAVRMTLELDGIQARGAEQVGEPLAWPVYFTVDDRVLSHLGADPLASDFVHAPGPQRADAVMRWQTELLAASVPAEQAWVGVGLMYSSGGVDQDSTWTAYQDLVKRVRAVALRQAASASGLAPLLLAYGAAWQPAWLAADPQRGLRERLQQGFDPGSLQLDDEPGLLPSLEAFGALASVLRQRLSQPSPSASNRRDVTAERQAYAAALRPRDLDLASWRQMLQSPPPPPAPAPAPAPAPTPAPIFSRIPPAIRVMPGLRPGLGDLAGVPVPPVRVPPIRVPPIGIPPAARATGDVVAVTLQAWPAQAVAAGAAVAISRALPARSALRASLTLQGRLTREL